MFEKLKNKIILVAGGAGFIGSNMCEKLLNLGARAIAFDNLTTGDRKNIVELKNNSNFIFIKGDVNKYRDLKNVFGNYKIDYALHYAAVVGVKKTLLEPLNVLKDIEGIKNILELSRLHKIKKIIFASSSEVYGEPQDLPEKEDLAPLNSRLPYAAVKVVGENFFRSYFEVYKLPTVNLRFFNVYGPRQRGSSYGFVTAAFIEQAIKNQPLTIFGRGLQTRDFVYIEDNLNATLLALLSKKSNGESINIGTGRETTILKLADSIIKISGKKLTKKFLVARKKGDMARRCPDVSKMRKILGYKPKYSLEQGLKITYQWYKNLP